MNEFRVSFHSLTLITFIQYCFHSVTLIQLQYFHWVHFPFLSVIGSPRSPLRLTLSLLVASLSSIDSVNSFRHLFTRYFINFITLNHFTLPPLLYSFHSVSNACSVHTVAFLIHCSHIDHECSMQPYCYNTVKSINQTH